MSEKVNQVKSKSIRRMTTIVALVSLTLCIGYHVKLSNQIKRSSHEVYNDASQEFQLSRNSAEDVFANGSTFVTSDKIPRLPTKTILLWNEFYNLSDFGAGGLGRKPFVDNKCDVTACRLVRNRKLLTEADAVIIHARAPWKPLKFRPPGQRYVFFLRESPSYIRTTFIKPFADAFNWTMTYRRDSDIPIPVSVIKPSAVAINYEDENYHLQFPLAERTRYSVWVVSHCETQSKREIYVSELRKYIDVDIIGACGNDTLCPSRNNSCFNSFIPARYKFYLAFENSVCEDYVTEKMFRTLQTEIIPVVYGGTNYTRDAPPHSVINVMDFESPRKLADYLKWLGNNETEYVKYFRWKGRYDVRETIRDGFCRLCEKLHRDHSPQSYRNVLLWWTEGMCRDSII